MKCRVTLLAAVDAAESAHMDLVEHSRWTTNSDAFVACFVKLEQIQRRLGELDGSHFGFGPRGRNEQQVEHATRFVNRIVQAVNELEGSPEFRHDWDGV